MRRSKVIFGIAIFAILISSSIAPIFAHATTIAHGGTLRLAFTSTIDNFSQFLTSSYVSWYFNQMAYPNLGIPLASGILHVATSSYWSNNNASIWYFRIRPGMHWSDGVPVNSTDLAFSLNLMFSTFSWGAGSLSIYSSYLASGNASTSIKIDNSSVVEVDLKQPFGTLGDIIGTENTPNLSPSHVLKNFFNDTTQPGNNFGTLVSSGAFNVTYHQGDSVVILRPNPFGSPFGGDSNGIPYLNEIDVHLVPSTQNLAFLLAGGQIDAAPLLPSDAVGLSASNPNIKIVSGPSPDTWNLEFPIWTYPYNETAFRQFLAYAVNRTDLVQTALSGYGIPGNEGYLPPSSDPNFNSSVPAYAYNPTMAKSLLDGMGWTIGGDGFYHLPNGSSFTPTLYVPAENQEIVTAGTRIVQFLKNAGLNAQIQTIATTSISTIWAKGLNMYVHEQNYGYPSSELLYDFSFDGFGTAGPLTGPVFVPTSVEASYNQTLLALNANGSSSGRAMLEQKLQGMIADYLPSITLFYVNSLWAVNTANFGGWPASPSTMDWPGGEFNQTALASIYSLSAQSSTTTTGSASSTTTTSPATSSSSTTSSTQTSIATSSQTTTTQTTTSSPPINYPLVGGVIVAIIVIAGVAAYAIRRRG